MDINSLKPNSHKYREEQRKKSINDYHANKLVTNDIRTVKKSPARKFLEMFITYDSEDIKRHVIDDILIPKVQNTLYEMGDGILGMLFSVRNKPSEKRGNKTYVSYQKYYGGDDGRKRDDEVVERHTIDDLIFATKGEAERVLEELQAVIDEYDTVRVADLYSMVDMPTKKEYTDNNWGWTHLGSAKVVAVRGGGYLLKLPRPKSL